MEHYFISEILYAKCESLVRELDHVQKHNDNHFIRTEAMRALCHIREFLITVDQETEERDQ